MLTQRIHIKMFQFVELVINLNQYACSMSMLKIANEFILVFESKPIS